MQTVRKTPSLGHQTLAFVVHPTREPQRRPDLLRHVGGHRRTKNKCPRVIDEMLLQGCAPTNKRASATERFPARVNRGRNLLCDSVPNSDSAPRGSLYPGRVGFVHNNTGSVVLRNFHDLGNLSNIAFHAKNTLGDDEFATMFMRMLSQFSFKTIQI